MVKVNVSKQDFLENFPNEGEAYAILESDDKYAFAWGTKYPYANELPAQDIEDESGGVKWFGDEIDEVRDYIEDVAMKPIPIVNRLYYDYDAQEWFSVEDILDWAIYTSENRFSHHEIDWPYHFIEALSHDHRDALIQKGKEYESIGWKVASFREAFWDGKEWVLNDESQFIVVIYKNPAVEYGDMEYILISDLAPTDQDREWSAKAETIDGHPAVVYWMEDESGQIDIDRPAHAELVY
mgnify:FL=1